MTDITQSVTLTNSQCLDLSTILRRELDARRLKLNSYSKAFGERKPREVTIEIEELEREAESIWALLEQIEERMR